MAENTKGHRPPRPPGGRRQATTFRLVNIPMRTLKTAIQHGFRIVRWHADRPLS
jgi:hypothetical protein